MLLTFILGDLKGGLNFAWNIFFSLVWVAPLQALMTRDFFFAFSGW